MALFGFDIQDGLALARRADPKYAAAWADRPAQRQAALAWYFLPHSSGKSILGVTRPPIATPSDLSAKSAPATPSR